MDAVLADYRSAPIDDRWKALFAFIERMNAESNTMQQRDTDAMIAAGWSEEAVYDAITVCALFNFYNRWIDASGVHALSDEAHRAGGKRTAMNGYVRK